MLCFMASHISEKYALLCDESWNGFSDDGISICSSVLFHLRLWTDEICGGGIHYIEKFPRNRILTFYVDVLVIAVIYSAVRLVTEKTLDWVLIIKTLTYGNTIISNGWYFQVMLILYLLFWISGKTTKTSKSLLIVCTSLVTAFCLLCMVIKEPQTRYESVMAFSLGMAVAYDQKLECLCRTRVSAIVAMVVFVVSVFGEYLLRGTAIGIVSKTVSALAFVICVLRFVAVIDHTRGSVLLTNPVMKWLGNRSFEIYALQGLFINTLRGVDAVYDCLPLYAVMVLALTMASATIVHIPITWLNGVIKHGNGKIEKAA